MFTHAPPFWYRPAAAPPPAPAAIFMGFDDVFTSSGESLAGQYTASKGVTFTGPGVLYDLAGTGIPAGGPANLGLSGEVAIFYSDAFAPSGPIVLTNGGAVLQAVTFYAYAPLIFNVLDASDTILFNDNIDGSIGPDNYNFYSYDLTAYPTAVKLSFGFNTFTGNDGFTLDNITITPA